MVRDLTQLLMTPFAYLALTLLTIWVFVLLLSEETRKEQIIMSLIGLVLSPAVLLLAASGDRSWDGFLSVGYDDFLFSFALFGVAAVIYQAVTGKQTKPIKRRRRRLKNRKLHWLARLLILAGIWLFISLLANLFFEIYLGQAFIVAGLLIGMYVMIDRRDLMINGLFSGAFIALLIFFLEKVFLLRLFPEAPFSLWPIEPAMASLAGVPLAEIVWAAIVGFTVGPLYEYVRQLKLK